LNFLHHVWIFQKVVFDGQKFALVRRSKVLVLERGVVLGDLVDGVVEYVLFEIDDRDIGLGKIQNLCELFDDVRARGVHCTTTHGTHGAHL